MFEEEEVMSLFPGGGGVEGGVLTCIIKTKFCSGNAQTRRSGLRD